MNESTNQITEDQLEQQAQQVPAGNTPEPATTSVPEPAPVPVSKITSEQISEPVQESLPTDKPHKKGVGLFVILLALVLVAGFIFFIVQMMMKANNADLTGAVPEKDTAPVENVMVKEKEPAQMTDEELEAELEKDIDQDMADLDKDLDAIENDLNMLTQ